MTEVKVLITSFGSIAKRHLSNVKVLLPGSEVAVLRTRGTGGLQSFEGVDHFLEGLDDCIEFAPDIVIIASPASRHVELAIPFLKRGIPTFIEKPLASEKDELSELGQLEELPFVMVGYVLRFQPMLHDIKRLIGSGKIGRPLIAQVQVGQYLPDWRPDADYRDGVSAQKKLGGGALLELSHEIDYATWLLGFPDAVFCSSSTISDLEIDVEDNALLILEYRNRGEEKKVVLQLDFLQRVPQMTIQLVGTEGTMKANLIREGVELFEPGHPEAVEYEIQKLDEGNEMYLRQFDLFFYKAIDHYLPRYAETKDFTEWATVSSSSRVLQIVEKAKESSRAGRVLEL